MEKEIEPEKIEDEKNHNIITLNLINSLIKNLIKAINKPKKLNDSIDRNKKALASNLYQEFFLEQNSDAHFSKIITSKIIFKKYARIVEYINKLIITGRDIKYKTTKIHKNETILKLSQFSIYIIKNIINIQKHSLNEKYLRILIIMTYWKILPIENFILIIKIFLHSTFNLIIQDSSPLDKSSLFNKSTFYKFINALFEALINVPKMLIIEEMHIKFINELIQILDSLLFSSSFYIELELYKFSIWFKLLSNKTIRLNNKYPLLYNELISFLVKIYKYNFNNLYYYKNFYEPSAISFDYYINVLDFLCALFKKEEEEYRSKNEFRIKNGFYIFNNMPLSLNNINFKLNSYSLIFSFKLTKIANHNQNTVLLSLDNYEQHKNNDSNILRFEISNDNKKLIIVDPKNNKLWKTNIVIDLNKYYLICFSQEKLIFYKKDTSFLFIGPENNETGCFHYKDQSLKFPEFGEKMRMYLGKNNFEGIFGEVIIINKIIKKEDINHLYNLSEDYADVINSLNNKYDFTSKFKKYTNENEDIIFFRELKYDCILKILTIHINPLLGNSKNVSIKPYGELKYSTNNASSKKELNIKIHSLNYSIEKFLNQHGLEYLIFQFHKIISLSENEELLNFYLYKTFKFVYEYIKMASSIIFPQKGKKTKTEIKYSNCILSLIIILNTKKKNFQLNEDIKDLLLDFNKIYREKKSNVSLIMNFNLLLDDKKFKKSNISNYEKLLDDLILEMENNPKDNSLIEKEVLYKILLIDDILESNEIGHKKFMRILDYFLIPNNENNIKVEKKVIKESLKSQIIKEKKRKKEMNELFYRYIMTIKSPKKLYHYLKYIYLNIAQIKVFLTKSKSFTEYISSNSNKIIDNRTNNKYVQNIQILYFLLNEIIYNVKDNKIFHFAKTGFMKNPNYKFMKCIFINYFDINNKSKLKFIKSSLIKDSEIDILKCCLEEEKKMKNLNILSLFNYSIFIPFLNSIIDYFFFIYKEYYETGNNELAIVLKQTIKLTFNFLYEILNANEKEFQTLESYNNISDDIIIQNKDLNNKNKRKQNKVQKFIIDLFSSSGLKLICLLYFDIYKEEKLKNFDINRFINLTINKIYNPFYFYPLLYCENSNENIDENNFYKGDILNMIIKNIISTFNIIKKKNSINNILVLNSIIILIIIHHIVHCHYYSLIAPQIEKNIINYIKYIIDNSYLHSKYFFNVNLKDDNLNHINIEYKDLSAKKEKNKSQSVENENKNHKLLSEIILDIIFQILETKDNPELISLLNEYFFTKNNSIFFDIDKYSFLEENNDNNKNKSYQYKMVNLLTSPKISTKYCSGINLNNILFSIYFLIYFVNKQKSFSLYYNKTNNLISLTNKALELLFKDCINIFQIYSKKIKKNKSKNVSNEIIVKLYDTFYEHFLTKYKENHFYLSNGEEISSYFYKFLQNSKNTKKVDRNSEDDELSLDLQERSRSNLNDISFISRLKMRKSTFGPDENILEKIHKMKSQKEKIEEKETDNNVIFERHRSSSENSSKLSTKNIKSINMEENANEREDYLYNNNSKNTEKEKRLICKEKINDNCNEDDSEINSSKDIGTTNINDSSSDCDSDSNSLCYENGLSYNSDFSTNQYINYNSFNIIEEKTVLRNRNRNNAISNKKLSSSNNSHSKSLEKIFNSPEIKVKEPVNKNIRGKKTTKYLPLFLEDEKEEKIEFKDDAHQYLNDKLKKVDEAFYLYKKFQKNNDPKSMRIVFNPKRFLFKFFGYSFKNFLFNDRRFNKLKSTFKIHFKDIELEKSINEEDNYVLNYPSRLRNFTCLNYYKPFLKPMLNFFENEYFLKSHSYIKNNAYKKDITEKDKFCQINYEKLNLNIRNKKNKEIKFNIKCESISNKGSIFGTIYFSYSLMVFKDKSKDDIRTLENIPEQKKLFFLFSSDASDRLKDQNKYIIIYYSEIKEIILRKYCFYDIAYEIFMKDGRSYFFNFFTLKNKVDFYNNLIEKINLINIDLRNKKYYKNRPLIYLKNDHNYIDILFIHKSSINFEKEYQNKYIKNEISNFYYLLLVNKFSSRSYNDCNQYLVFPLLYMDVQKTKQRDLSKAICLNRELTEDDIQKYESNYEIMGYHFNSHYSTMAYTVYYLVRLIPFTFNQIKLQSGHFDAPSRMFTSLDNFLFVFQISDENRELCPEFFYFYESFLNLNYNDFGYSKINKKQIHNFNTSENCGIYEFIIDLRKILEKKELSPWLDNIFGINQLNDKCKNYNIFPDYSYEQCNKFNEEKENIYSEIGEEELDDEKKIIINEKINSIKNGIQLLSLGLTPSQIFKNHHPKKEAKNKNINDLYTDINSEKNNKKKNKNIKSKIVKVNSNLTDFINRTSFEDLIYIFSNYNNSLKIIFMFKKQINIFNYLSENEKGVQLKKIDLDPDIQIIEIKPYKNLLVELFDNTFLISRLSNRSLLLYHETTKFYIEWPSIVTAIEFYSHDEFDANTQIHINKILVGDEEGNLSLIEVETEYTEKKKLFKINSLECIEKRQKIFYSYINGILYNKRLNIIISSCNDGIISINNGFSFEILNIIEIDNSPNVLDFKLSEYDLLYIFTESKSNLNNNNTYQLSCYSLNGIKVSELNTKKEHVYYYVNNNEVNVIYKDGSFCKYNLANLKEIENLDKEEIKDISNNREIFFGLCCRKLQNIFIIFYKGSKIIKLSDEV